MSYKRISPIPIIEGGTGSSSGLTAHGVLVGEGTSPINPLAVGTNGQVLIGSSAADPAFATLTSTGGTIAFILGAHSLNLETSGSLPTTFDADSGIAAPVSGIIDMKGGSNISTSAATNIVTFNLSGTTQHAVQIGNSGGSLTSLGLGTGGAVLLSGDSSADPSFVVPTAGTGLSVTTNASTLSFALSAPVSVPNGGTGDSSFTAYAVLTGGTTSTGALQSIASVGTTGQVLTSNGASALPTFQTIAASGVTSITGTTGGAQTGAITLAGGTTGLAYGGSAGTITSTFAGITANAGVVNLGTDSTANAINIGTVSNTGRTVSIGDTTGTTGIVARVGTGNFSLDGVTNSTYAIGASTTTGTITIGGTAQTGAINLGTSTGGQTISIAGGATGNKIVTIASSITTNTFNLNIGNNITTGTANISIANNVTSGGGLITIGSSNASSNQGIELYGGADGITLIAANSGSIDIASGTGGSIDIVSGTGTLGISDDAAATSVSIATGAGVKTTIIGSTNTTSTTTVQSGSGALNITSTNGALTIDAGTGTLGIATDAAANTINIGTGGAAKTLTLGSTNTTSSTLIKSGSGNIIHNTGFTINSSGIATSSVQPAFLVYLQTSLTAVTGNATSYTVIFDTKSFDQGTNFTLATGIFTAPVTGKYLFSSSLFLSGTSSTNTTGSLSLNLNSGSAFNYLAQNGDVASAGLLGNWTLGGSTFLQSLTAGNTMSIRLIVSGSATANIGIIGNATSAGVGSYFAGYLVC